MSRIARVNENPEESAARAARDRLKKAQEATDEARIAYFAAGRDTLGERQQAYDLANHEEIEAQLAYERAGHDARESRKPSERRRAEQAHSDSTEA